MVSKSVTKELIKAAVIQAINNRLDACGRKMMSIPEEMTLVELSLSIGELIEGINSKLGMQITLKDLGQENFTVASLIDRIYQKVLEIRLLSQ